MNRSIETGILDTITKDQNEIIEFTKDLVAIATENPPGTYYKQCVEVICKKLAEIGLEYKIIEVPENGSGEKTQEFPRYCILSSFGAGKKTFYFHGHYDVVPASSREQFNPHIRGDKLYGRGSSDMKSGLAAMIFAVKALKDSNAEPDGSVCLTIVPDEETGGARGAKYLSDAGILGKDGIAMLLPEPTSGVVWNASRGALSLQITVKGKYAHVGLQHEGINAFENMISVANALLGLKKEVETRTTEYNLDPPSARKSILLMGGRTEGGTNFNVVPGEFTFTIDRRINPEEDLKTEKERLFEIFEDVRKKGIDLEVKVLQEGEAAGIPEEGQLAQILSQNIETFTGRRPKFEMCPGILETRFYTGMGMPAFAYGPGILSCSHGPDEYVDVKEIFKCTTIYALTALEILSA